MQPNEIKPDTQLCTIIGYNAQSGTSRRYLNRILKDSTINATAIALNIKEEHFAFTMQNLAQSKVDKMIIEYEFGVDALNYCNEANSTQYVDFVEVVDGKIVGFNLDEELSRLVNTKFLDQRSILALKMMLIAHRWYNVDVEIDKIPIIIKD
ncbi:MAG: hypothetical protein KU38_10820 [Sulfurovum sp. FS08-3]|nr:MAG: hypothetical protein KU38_10820 [Sulfurovum sp. FS08-3]